MSFASLVLCHLNKNILLYFSNFCRCFQKSNMGTLSLNTIIFVRSSKLYKYYSGKYGFTATANAINTAFLTQDRLSDG